MRKSLIGLGLLLTSTAMAAQPAPSAIAYPPTARGTVSETQFGAVVADPYRWLENDVRTDAQVRAWVDAQAAVADRYLKALPGRNRLAARMRELYDFERAGVPEKRGARLFYTKNDGLQNQSPLYVRDGTGAERLLLDPNGWAKDGATALAEWEASDDGARLVYGVQEGGTDWRTLRVLDVAGRAPLADEVKWVKFSGLSWAKDGSGFYYSRFPEPAAGATFQALNKNQAVYFHRIGTPQASDRLVYSTPTEPDLGHSAEVSDDGRWLIVTTSQGTDERYDVTLVDLPTPNAKPRALITGRRNDWRYVGNRGNEFYWTTDAGAPRLKLVAMDVAKGAGSVRDIVGEDAATLEGASLVGGRFVLSYLKDAKSEVRTYGSDGKLLRTVALPGLGRAFGFDGEADDPVTYFGFTSYDRPTTVYRHDAASGATTPWFEPKLAFDPERFSVKQRFYRSKDGTRVPMFVVRKAGGPAGPRPTLLYGYGGFNISVTPGFAPAWLAWLDAGGQLAVANLRGGGEYGKAWHDAGRLANKQNVFDDFVAAAEYLVAEKLTTPRQLAAEGRSNGGLLVGAVVNQRPDLFAAALPTVGVMDMLRFNRFTAGRYWVDDYGYPNKEADFRALRAYSPYHNIRSGARYPAVLAVTADTDDRVVPGHSFKYIAALQAAETGNAPKLIRIETRAGHGAGKPTDKLIEEYADIYAFAAFHTGLKLGE